MQTVSRPSFDEYVATRTPALLRFAYVLCGDRHLAEDLVQEVLVRAHRRWSAIEADDPDAYLKRAIVREHISWRRRRAASEIATAVVRERVSAARFDEEYATRNEVWALLAALPPRQRAVLVLRYFEDLDDRRIAELVGSSAVSVRVNAHHGLTALRETLTRRAEQAPAGAGMVDAVRLAAARRRRIAMGAAGAGLAAIIAVLLLVLPYLLGGGDETPPVEPTPTSTPSPLPTSTLELVPAVRPADPTFPYVPTWLPTGYTEPLVEDYRREVDLLRLSYRSPDGGVIDVSLTPGPYEFWDFSSDVEQTTVNGMPAQLRSGPAHDAPEGGCVGVSWRPGDGWLTVVHCWWEPEDELSTEDLVRFAEGLVPGTIQSTPQPDDRVIVAAALPPGYILEYRDQWAGWSLCATSDSDPVGICISVEPIEPGTGSASPLRIDGHPAIDWVVQNSPLYEGPRYTLTVYRDTYKIHVATTDAFTLGDRIAIYRSVVLRD